MELSLQVGWLFSLRKRSNTTGTGAVLVVDLKPKRINDSQCVFKLSLVVDELKFDVLFARPLSGALISSGARFRRHDFFSVEYVEVWLC